MITGMALLSFMSNKPWALKFLTQQEYKVLIRITGFVLLFIGILYAVQIMQFEARKRQITSGHDSANNPHREYTTETSIDLLFTTLGNFSTDVLANNNGSYTTDRNRSPYPGEDVSADMSAKRNSSITSVSWIPIAESDAKTDKTRNNYKMESDTNVSSSLSEEDNYTSQIGWLPDPDTNASAEISVEGHSNKTVTSWLPAPDISAPVTAKDCFNSSSEIDVLPTTDSKVLSAKLSKDSGNYSTIETNPFPSVDRNMFTAMMSRNKSGLSQTNLSPTNLSPSPRNNISAAINTKNYLNVSKGN
ncbi:Protein of unknown function [Gryllus bimaculatus]|nr:Protein of unknown function [Gryllus bimaculatus]